MGRLPRWLRIVYELPHYKAQNLHGRAALKNRQMSFNDRNSLLIGAVMLAVGLVLLVNNALLSVPVEGGDAAAARAYYKTLYLAMVGLGSFLLFAELIFCRGSRPLRLALRFSSYGGIVWVILLITGIDYRLYRDFAPFLLAQLLFSAALSLPLWIYPLINLMHLAASLAMLLAVDRAHFLTERVWILPAVYSLMAIAAGLSAEASRQRAWRAELELAHINEELRASSFLDPLTGLYNRRYLSEIFGSVAALARRGSGELCVLMLDADHFKDVNDTYGHVAGDRALVEMAGVIHHCIRASDIASRYGGEEFLVLLPTTGLHGAEQVAERILSSMRGKIIEGINRPVTASAGLALMSNEDTEISLFERADQALYQAKRSGRDRLYINKS